MQKPNASARWFRESLKRPNCCGKAEPCNELPPSHEYPQGNRTRSAYLARPGVGKTLGGGWIFRSQDNSLQAVSRL
jgi:hypothetical protein